MYQLFGGRRSTGEDLSRGSKKDGGDDCKATLLEKCINGLNPRT